MLARANGFYISPLGKDEIRIAYVLKEPDLRRAVELLRIALERGSHIRARPRNQALEPSQNVV